MAGFSTSFLVALLVVLYLLSLIFFAVIRIATGVSIQRLGYFSLRRVSYTFRDGVRIDIHSLGLYLHRPTFAKPTWLSLRLSDLKVTVDASSLSQSARLRTGRGASEQHSNGMGNEPSSTRSGSPASSTGQAAALSWSKMWGRLTAIKERIKAAHGKIQWLRMVDLEILNSSCTIAGVATLQIASMSAAVDTRRKTIDRGRLFRHKKPSAGEQQPAEWIFILKGVLFTAEGNDSLEILDMCSLNVHGFLYKSISGLRDTSISLKLGRIHVPYDEIISCQKLTKDKLGLTRLEHTALKTSTSSQNIGAANAESNQTQLSQTFLEFREFVSSILRGIQEIQLAISFIGLSKAVQANSSLEKPLYLNFTMNEFGIDLFRLDPKGPAHRMYFASQDVAHQALLAAISIGVSVDVANGEPQRILYVPMATVTVKTTLPTKTIVDTSSKNAADRNANILFANLVVTSPSIDLDLKHLSLIFTLLHNRRLKVADKDSYRTRQAFSKLLPKASIKISIQEPVARVVLPPSEPKAKEMHDYDLLISSITAISLEAESSHTASGDNHYSLDSNLRVSSHRLYYQAASGTKYILLNMDALETRLHLAAIPSPSIVLMGNLETFSIHIIRPEISEGLNQIVQQLSKSSFTDATSSRGLIKPQNLLRRFPSWLTHLHFRASRFGIEVGAPDPGISQHLRGVAPQLQSWILEYKCSARQSLSQTIHTHGLPENEDKIISSPREASSRLLESLNASEKFDSRVLILHAHGFKVFAVDGPDLWEPDPFLAIPKIEVSMLISGDQKEKALHIDCHIRALFVHYSLYRYYVSCIGLTEMRRAFSISNESNGMSQKPVVKASPTAQLSQGYADNIIVDVKVPILQIKASLPHEPSMMLQIYSIECGQHRWSSPFLKSRLVRLYAEVSGVKAAWARLVSIKNFRGDLRDSRRKFGQDFVLEKSFDAVTEFIRLAVPHQIVLHKVFDNIINVLKATEQLNYRFKTGTNTYILSKGPQEAKKVPRISLRSKIFMFEIEDGLFEWKLGLIYRVGLSEQKQRLAREDAFQIKVKKVQEQSQRRDSSRHPQQSGLKSRGRIRPDPPTVESEAAGDDGHESRKSSISPSSKRGRRSMRYDTDAISGLTENARISAEDAWLRLQEHNAASWKRRILSALHFQKHSLKDVRKSFWSNDEPPSVEEDSESILSTPERPGLMTTLVSDLHIVVDKPSFPVHKSSTFLHRIGKGVPVSTEYSLLIPMSLVVSLGETQVTLRNYPLPLLHVPAIRTDQSSRLPSWSIKTDFIIAEEFRSEDSMRNVQVEVISAGKPSASAEIGNRFCIDVRRTVSPVKTYSDVDVTINTARSTSITWGTSYQPAIQDMMQIIESFTKPQFDPSDRVGFWDKIRLLLHSRVRVAWKGRGDVQLQLKGSRDPYSVTGHGAGFVMCFRSDVRWGIHQEDDPKKFMTVNCEEYVLAIPDYSHQARESSRGATLGVNINSPSPAYKHAAIFKKVIVKLKGRVRWLAGLVFEREKQNGSRSFDFVPHYEIKLRTPRHVHSLNTTDYDAFRGFRSHCIHLSIAVIAPADRDWSVTNNSSSSTYNSMHMSPKFFTHFYDWWSLFSGIMSLPIRQGRLFPGREKSSKKFGRHLATIKYNLLLAPFFISHIYKHKDVEDYASDVVGATGLKLGLESFMLDLHQRREEFASQGKGRLKVTKTSGMRINRAQVDFMSADIRAVSASIKGTTAEDLKSAPDSDLSLYHDQAFLASDAKHFAIPDLNFDWIDMDDFVELDWILPAETHPQTHIMPLAFAPRFTYIRQTDHTGMYSQDSGRSSRFGDEPTHFCVMTADNDPQRVQRNLIQNRISFLQEQLKSLCTLIAEQAAKFKSQQSPIQKEEDQLPVLEQQREMIEQKISFMQSMLRRILGHLHSVSSSSGSLSTAYDSPRTVDSLRDLSESEEASGVNQPFDLADDFNNRFVIHNIQLKWNNSLRNIILRYVHQVSQRRGFVYYMSRRAVKFILDIVEEQQKNKQKTGPISPHQTPTSQSSPVTSPTGDSSTLNLEERIRELLNDGKSFVAADDPKPSQPPRRSSEGTHEDLSEEFTAQNSYHLRLIAPQIQLQSERNSKSVVLVTAREMRLKVIQIMDRNRLADDVSGLVQRRFSVDMDGVQFFVTNQKTINQFVHLHSANRYGSPKGSAWPPWAPVEVNFDFEMSPFGWYRVVQKTSASLRYDKYNTLRLKYNDEVNKGDNNRSSIAEDVESRIDHLWVDFPQIRAICDSTQYYAMYVIVLDLLLYSEPLEKIRSERLEKIMLATDFSDLSGTPEMVTSLQERVRQLEEIKSHFQLHARQLDRQGWQDRLAIERDLASCEDELFFIMKAITTSQRKSDERTPDSQTNGLLRWYLSASEIVWHLMRENNQPLAELQLQRAIYDRTDNSDGSNHNLMEIERIHGLNLLPNATYPEMIAPYFEPGIKESTRRDSIKMFKVQWIMLEAIAGIPVLDQFEVNLFPVKVQLEREIGKKLFEYIFPGNGDHNGASPFLIKQSSSQDGDGDDSDDVEENGIFPSLGTRGSFNSTSLADAASLELRLRPTITLHAPPSPTRPTSSRSKVPSSTLAKGESDQINLGNGPGRTRATLKPQSSASLPAVLTSSRKKSGEGFQNQERHTPEASSTNLSLTTSASERSRRSILYRANSDAEKEKSRRPDELTVMMSRASNYMTLAYAKVPSVVLCLSYKGRGERNFEDLHNFVLRMPTLEYRNKTWSNLDLALRVKKDVIKALISHTGAIIGNKFHNHRPAKSQHNGFSRAATSTSLLLPNNHGFKDSTSRTSGNVPGSLRRREGLAVRSTSSLFAESDAARDRSQVSTPDSTVSSGASTGSSQPRDSDIDFSPAKPRSTKTGASQLGGKESYDTLALPSDLQDSRINSLMRLGADSTRPHLHSDMPESSVLRPGSSQARTSTGNSESRSRKPSGVLNFGKKIFNSLNS